MWKYVHPNYSRWRAPLCGCRCQPLWDKPKAAFVLNGIDCVKAPVIGTDKGLENFAGRHSSSPRMYASSARHCLRVNLGWLVLPLTSPPIGEALADDAFNSLPSAFRIGHVQAHALVVAEIKFR